MGLESYLAPKRLLGTDDALTDTLPSLWRELTVTDLGEGRVVLLLHGGAGPTSVTGFATLLAENGFRAITPVHPGFAGTPRRTGTTDVPGLASMYAAVLDELELSDVVVVGSSLGGWVAAELALLAPSRVGALVLIDAIGIDVTGHPVANVLALTPDEITELAFHDADRFRVDPATLPPAAQAAMAADGAALAAYTGGSPSDPTLAGRLGGITAPTLVLWGASDGIVEPGYGRAYAAAIPGARFELIPDAGHQPQLEAPEPTLRAVVAQTAD